MRNWLRKKIKAKLKNYKIDINTIDDSLPFNISTPKKVAVVGAGIAGLSAAANLAERGFDVTLYEKNNYLCVDEYHFYCLCLFLPYNFSFSYLHHGSYLDCPGSKD